MFPRISVWMWDGPTQGEIAWCLKCGEKAAITFWRWLWLDVVRQCRDTSAFQAIFFCSSMRVCQSVASGAYLVFPLPHSMSSHLPDGWLCLLATSEPDLPSTGFSTGSSPPSQLRGWLCLVPATLANADLSIGAVAPPQCWLMTPSFKASFP